MMGTGPFAVPTFRALFQTHHAVVALVTSPLRRHRGKLVAPVSPIRDVARENDVPILDPEDINSEVFRAQLAQLQADLFIVCDYGQILSAATLATARLGGVNLHGSLLPKYRGAAPINWALYHGEQETGVSVIHMTPRVDAGPVIAQARIDIGADETASQLEPRLAELGGWLMRRSIDAVEAGRLEAMPQDPAQASRAPRLKKSDGIIDWLRPAGALKNHVRAMDPWPGCYTWWLRPDMPPIRLIIGPLDAAANHDSPAAAPGTVIEVTGDRLVIAAGEGAVAPRAVQPAGKRMMPVAEFLRGHRIQPGDRLGNENERV